MDSSDADCEAYCAVKPIGKGVPERTAPTRHAGPLPTLMRLGFSTCNKPISQHVSPLAGKTTNRRAVCREIRMSGSEGGGIEANRCFLPLLLLMDTDRMCADKNSMEFIHALMHHQPPPDQLGLAYMLGGDTGPSGEVGGTCNSSPYATAIGSSQDRMSCFLVHPARRLATHEPPTSTRPNRT